MIAYFNDITAVEPAVSRLNEAGISNDRIQVVSNPDSVSRLLGCDPICMIGNYAVMGAAISVGIYLVFGMAAALCQCNLMQFGLGYGIGTFLGAILAGTFVGGVIGLLVGADRAERDSHLYVQGTRSGGKVVFIRLSDRDNDRVKEILQQENALGVRLVQQGEA